MKIKHPEFILKWTTDAASARLPGGESLPELQERVWDVVQRILADNHSGSVVIVSHFFALLSIICKVLGLGLSEFRRFGISVASISMLEFNAGKVRLHSFNDTCHLS